MKKILIASACAFALCLTSCASKKAPETESQTEVPQIEAETEETAEENGTDTVAENTDAEEEAAVEENEEDALTAETEEPSLTSEAFPEPEDIQEEEIITLEPVEEAEAPLNEPASEEVEKEEPPEITIVNQDTSAAALENQSSEPANNDEAESSNELISDNPTDTDFISGGIDITDDDSDSGEEYSELEKDITPSRSVTLKKFEYLDVTYPGTGWIYMGLTDNSKDLAYFGRKLGTKDTKFSLQARTAGTKIIHFYRNDPLTGQYLDDYIEVIITAENGSNKTHIEAPEYKLPVQKKEKPVVKTEEKTEKENEKQSEEKTEATASQAKATVTETKASEAVTAKVSVTEEKAKTSTSTATAAATESAVPVTESATVQTVEASAATTTPSNPDALLQDAQILYNEKEYSAALNKLNQFFEYSTDKGDQALYLKGQILEAKSDVRDIKGAIDAYTTLTKNYPASKFWDNANKRIIYLKRFYLEVR